MLVVAGLIKIVVGLIKIALAMVVMVLIPSTLVLACFYGGFWGFLLWAVAFSAWWFNLGPFNARYW